MALYLFPNKKRQNSEKKDKYRTMYNQIVISSATTSINYLLFQDINWYSYAYRIEIWQILKRFTYTHLIRDICLLMGEFVVVSQFTIFLLELLGSAEKPMAGPSNSKRKIVSWDKFRIIGGKNKWLLLNVPI